ncbi:hypothetical protein AALP_AAs66918U001200 [Arabis alpina]|uniref:RRM domain-containing protein n=1 Tax=Arabis alpina TaxID=50452 RepID=A0A087G0Z6_ARAAL|nr:hypothetical protein AALP_AAs66918U001200 [Arabis alpina]
MVMEDKRLKPCDQKPLQEAEETPVRKAKRKMSSEIKEMKRLRKSFKEMTESVNKLQETLLMQSVKEKETTPEVKEYKCIYESKEPFVKHHKDRTLFIRGFDPCRSMDDVKTALRKHLGSCGVITRVFVPTECKTGATVGYAFVDMQSDEGVKKALTYSGTSFGGWNLDVAMAKGRLEFTGLTNRRGCERCFVIVRQRIVGEFIATNGGRCLKFP